jgi:uncharacterized protein (UPF0335 family)
MTDQITADELRAFVDRIEQGMAEQKDAAETVKDTYSEAKGRGYDPKVLRKVVADRKKERDALAEFEAVEELYRSALGMQ